MKKLTMILALVIVMGVYVNPVHALTPPQDVLTSSKNPNPDFPLTASQLDGWAMASAAEADRRWPDDQDIGELVEWNCKWDQQGSISCENKFNLPEDYCWHGYIYITAEYTYNGPDDMAFVDLTKEWRED